jgi:hypothetical protein
MSVPSPQHLRSNPPEVFDLPRQPKIPQPPNEEDFVLVRAQDSDFLEIHEFMLGDFLSTEPMNAALELTKEEANQFFADIIRCSLHEGVSYLVRSAGEGTLVAIRLACVLDRSSPEENQAFGATYSSAKVETIKGLLHQFEEQVRIC